MRIRHENFEGVGDWARGGGGRVGWRVHTRRLRACGMMCVCRYIVWWVGECGCMRA